MRKGTLAYDVTPDMGPTDDGPSLIRLYVQVHEHRAKQAPTTTHIGILHGGEARQ